MSDTDAKDGLSKLDMLLSIEEIKQLKARYFRSLDTRNWALYRTLFTQDVVVDFRGATTDSESSDIGLETLDNDNVVRGAKAWTDLIEETQRKSDLTTKHHGHMPEIEITSPDTATGIWALDDVVCYGNDPVLERFHGWAYYYETYRRIDGKWLIATMKLTRVKGHLVHKQAAA